MENEYITKESALSCFNDWIDRYGHEHSADEMIEYQRIEELPVANVRSVVRGEWFEPDDDYSYLVCSVCEERSPNDERWNYCPNCGADMRGE